MVSGHGSTSGESNFTSTDKLYLLSTHEVWTDVDGNTSSGIDYYDTSYSNTKQLDYYEDNGVTTSSYSKAIKKNGSSAELWLTRTAYSNSVNYFGYVYSNDSMVNATSTDDNGVSPAFRIG